jgi:hypothetical protein
MYQRPGPGVTYGLVVGQRSPGYDADQTRVNDLSPWRPDLAGAVDGARHERDLAGDRDGEGAVLEPCARTPIRPSGAPRTAQDASRRCSAAVDLRARSCILGAADTRARLTRTGADLTSAAVRQDLPTAILLAGSRFGSGTRIFSIPAS